MSESVPSVEPVIETPAAPDFGAMQSIDEYQKAREDVTTAETEPVEPEPASEAGAEGSKKKRTLDTRREAIKVEIDALTKTKYDTKREADAARAELQALRAELSEIRNGASQSPQQPQQASQPQPYVDPTDPEPKETAYFQANPEATYDDFIREKADWVWRQRDRERYFYQQQQAAVQQEQALLQTVQAREAAFVAEHADYYDVVNSAMIPAETQTGQAIIAHLRHSDLGPALAYALGKDPAEMARIASLAPGFAVAALGRLEARIDTRPEDAKVGPSSVAAPVTNAPDPIKPVGGMSTGASTADPSEINSIAAWRKKRHEYL